MKNGAVSPEALPPLSRLLTVYAPADARAWHGLCWTLDQRLAALIRQSNEPMIGAIRLAWWEEVLVADDRAKGAGEPLVEQWRAGRPEAAGRAAAQLIDGWRALLETDELDGQVMGDYARGRGAGLFALIAAGDEAAVDAPQDEMLRRAGAVWALWDLAGHMRDEALATAAMRLAEGEARGLGQCRFTGALKPLSLAYDLARRDVLAGRLPRGGFGPRHYRRLLWRGLFA